MLPSDVLDTVESIVGASVIDTSAVGGGCIGNTSRVETEHGPYFLKWSRDEVADTFEPEAAGLNALRDAGTALIIPEVVSVHGREEGQPGLLLMEWVEPGKKPPAFWENFGRGLASLHRHTADRYGFVTDNYIGRLPQQNDWMDDWPDFFWSRRIEPQARLARESGRWKQSWNAHMESLSEQLNDIVPSHPEPSILHGDLWGGNFLVSLDGRAALVDPAAYFGHREADLGMTRLFGGFGEGFYSAYRETWPLEAGYDERLEIYNLYHLINHLNHFGAGYAGSVERILKRF